MSSQNKGVDPILGPNKFKRGDQVITVVDGEAIGLAQRTTRGLRWEAKQAKLSEMLQDEAKRKQLDASFSGVLATKGVTPSSVHADQFLSNLSQQYANDSYIGERLILSVPVQKRTGKYAVYPKREMFEAPSDLLSTEKARANEISSTRSSASYELKDYGLENFVSNETLENQDIPFNERADMVMELAEHLARKREVRDAALLTTAGNYGSGNTTTLSGSDQWNSASGGNPIKNIQDAKAALFNGPGATDVWGFTSLDAFNVLARHAQLLDLQKYTINGLLTPESIARYLGLAGLLIGEARKQTANEGATESYSRIWGNDFGLVRVARAPSLRTASFAARFRKQSDPVVTEWFDATAGKSGGYYIKNAVSEDLRVVASFGGYLIKSCISG
jgi:hypothetical protein